MALTSLQIRRNSSDEGIRRKQRSARGDLASSSAVGRFSLPLVELRCSRRNKTKQHPPRARNPIARSHWDPRLPHESTSTRSKALRLPRRRFVWLQRRTMGTHASTESATAGKYANGAWPSLRKRSRIAVPTCSAWQRRKRFCRPYFLKTTWQMTGPKRGTSATSGVSCAHATPTKDHAESGSCRVRAKCRQYTERNNATLGMGRGLV